MVAEKLPGDKVEAENNLTISTKLSTDQLICKSPQTSSPEGSVRSLRQVIPLKDEGPSGRKKDETPMALYFGVLQILFGLLMAVFGVLVLVHEASLSQIGGGLWGGCLATLTGVLGVLSAARDCCPLKTSPQRLALTAFLALSLVSLAVANLVLVLAAIGLARDASKSQESDRPPDETLPSNYASLLSGAGLLVVAACECVAAALSAWHCAKALCPCFRQPEPGCNSAPASLSKDLLVSSWLGKHQQPVYVVATNQRTKRMTPIPVAQMYSLPTPPSSLMAPPVMGYPLIPAPLGSTPPPRIHPHHPQPLGSTSPPRNHPHHPHHPPSDKVVHKKRRRYPSDRQLQQQQRHVARQEKPRKQKKTRDKQKPITEEEVAKTYTGLDRVIAEEFIQICDSTRTTSGSDMSGCTSSETTSNEFAGERL